MRISLVNGSDRGGGAEVVVQQLLSGYREAGHEASLLTRRKLGQDKTTIEIPVQPAISRWAAPVSGWLASRLADASRPLSVLDRFLGREDFRFSSTRQLDRLTARPPHIFHLHNLHGRYFDLTALPALSARFPIVLTLHDCWLMSGHCAHSFDCERWRTGCGNCPDLGIYPAIRRDATSYNWLRKQRIFKHSRIYLAAPSRWLMERAKQSILAPAIQEARVIENGVDDAFFASPDKAQARAALCLPEKETVLLFAANSIRDNEWKDYATLRRTLEILTAELDRPLTLIALGDVGAEQRIGKSRLVFAPFENDPSRVALYYAAADLYLHASKVETFSLTVAEAMAAGTPVVATAAGAVVERIRSLDSVSADQATGILVKTGDGNAMAAGVAKLLNDRRLASMLGANAKSDAKARYDRQRFADSYIAWFDEILSRWPAT